MDVKVKKRGGKGFLLLLAVVIAIGVIVPNTKSHKYKKAQDLLWEGQYNQAAEIFIELDGYENAEELLLQCKYGQAKRLVTNKEYDRALLALEALGDYEDCPQLIQECYYQLGREAFQQENYEEAVSRFLQAGDFPDALAELDSAYYEYGHQLFLEGRYVAAQNQFDQIQTLPAHAQPHFQYLEDAGAYLKEQAAMLADEISCFICQQPIPPSGDSLWDVVGNYVPFRYGSAYYDHIRKTLNITAEYYPGDRIFYAWQTGDASDLSEEEMQAMQVAEDLVAKAKQKSDNPLDIELYLYNWLCNHVEYESPNMDVDKETYMGLRQLNCLGALLDGKANCQGYTDAFYLLGKMAGFDVCRISGTGEWEPHSWNGIMLNEQLYIVDVTFGDADELGSTGKTYTWFNCAYDPQVYAINGGAEMFPELVTVDDLSQSYYAYKKSIFTKLSDASYYLLRQYKKNGKGFTFAVVEDAEITNKQLESSLKKNRAKAGVSSYKITYMTEYYNGNTYIVVQWK